MNNCRLCPNKADAAIYDRPLLETENFALLPSLGALVEGWLLLIPKKHFICIGSMPQFLESEFAQLKRVATSFVEEVYGSATVFEHGPHKQDRSVGCGVDHAHLHILPVRFDLRSAVSPFLPNDTCWFPAGLAECRLAYSKSRDYLYLEEKGRGYITTHDSLGSQLFRRGIAKQLGVLSKYNWREFPNLDNVERTIMRARQWSFHRRIAADKLEAAA